MKKIALYISLTLLIGMFAFTGCDKNDRDESAGEQPLVVADENSECTDGTCPLPVRPKEADLTNPELRFETGECFTFVVDDEAVKTLGSTREEVMLAIYEARTNGKYNTIEELLNLTVKIRGKDVAIKSLVKIKK